MALFSGQLHGQNSSNACTNAAANTYPVNGTCVPLGFNKPSSYTATYNPGGCGASSLDDAWGSFVATSTATLVKYTPTTSGADAILHVLASCTGPVLACADNLGANGAEQVTVATVPGTRYYVRVQGTNNSAMNGTLCLYNVQCKLELHLYDSGNNGWSDWVGTAYVVVLVNGMNMGAWTLNSGSAGVADIWVNEGDEVQFIYYSGGALYYTQNSFEVTGAGQCLFRTDRPVMQNKPYKIIASCTASTAAQPQDCVGGVTVCSGQSITQNATTPGCSIDLNATNRGCLLNNERQGSWYFFSPSTAGTLGFTLTPSGNDDYDFALWGPFDAAQCPNVPPVRCSYFDNAYYNSYVGGMGNGATDFSEGAGRPPNSNNGWVAPLNVLAGKVYVLYIDNWSATGQNFSLTWNLTGGTSLNCTTLPVELLSLDARARVSTIDVLWATATEQDAAYFEVQRSADGNTFHTVGQVAAMRNSQQRVEYLFTDDAPLSGANYYRLNQVDVDGRAELSEVVVAFMGGMAWGRPVLFPNPARDRLQVLFTSTDEGTGSLEVQDALGRVVARQAQGMWRGQVKGELPTGQLAKGWYSLRVVLPGGSSTQSAAFVKE